MQLFKKVTITFLIGFMSASQACYKFTQRWASGKLRPSIQFLFPDKRDLASEICDYIDKEKKSILFAQYMFSHISVIEACKKAKNERGVRLEGVVDRAALESLRDSFLQRGKSEQNALIRNFLFENGIDIYAQPRKILHHKLILLEKNGANNEPVIIAGSANITKSGLDSICNKNNLKGYSYNAENMIVIKNHSELFNQVKLEIEHLRKLSKISKQNREKAHDKK